MQRRSLSPPCASSACLYLSLSLSLSLFSGVKTPLYNIGRAYGTWIDDVQSSIF